MAKVKAIKQGYYDHRLIPDGAIFEMKEVDAEGFYLDKNGKKKLFQKFDRHGNEVGEPEPRKCLWVGPLKSKLARPKDPVELARVISGKAAISGTSIEAIEEK